MRFGRCGGWKAGGDNFLGEGFEVRAGYIRPVEDFCGGVPKDGITTEETGCVQDGGEGHYAIEGNEAVRASISKATVHLGGVTDGSTGV